MPTMVALPHGFSCRIIRLRHYVRDGAQESPETHVSTGPGTRYDKVMSGRLTIGALVDRAEISDVVLRYATAVDQRDWKLYRTVFTEKLIVDFSSWSGEPEMAMAVDDWVETVRKTLSGFDATHHLSSNHVTTLSGESAICVSYMVARHYLVENGERLMHSIGGHYTNRLDRTADGWKIAHCALTVTWEMGDRGLFEIAAARVSEGPP